MNRIINYYYEFRYQLLRYHWLKKSKKSNVNGIVLMYHHITDETVDMNVSCKCKVDDFKRTLKKLRSEGYQFLSVQTSLEIIQQKSDLKFAVVTFDDVPDNVYFNAYPILRELQIPFILFVTTSFINKPGFLSVEQIKEMALNPLCSIGSHAVTHSMLRKVKNSMYELKQSKKSLEKLLNKPIEYLAYPYGRQSSVSRRIIKQAKLTGYKCAFGTIQAPISDFSSKNLYFLPRLVIN